MIRDPRVAFDSCSASAPRPSERAARRKADKSILDWITGEVARLQKQPRRRRPRPPRATTSTKCARSNAASSASKRSNASGEVARAAEAPIGVPDSFDEHVKLMFDLQVLAFASDITRVFSFKMGRDGSSARLSRERRHDSAFHPASHHGDREDRILDFAKINKYHVSMLPYFLDKLKNTPDGDGNLLDNTMVIYGSPMGNSNVHNHKRCPLFVAGHAGGALKGNLHIKAADGTPMANVDADDDAQAGPRAT